MTDARKARILKGAFTIALAVVLGATLGGCKKSTTTTTPAAGQTAQQALKVAQSAVATVAPDSKLLVVSTAGVVATEAPVWQYLLGSPKNDTVYAVIVAQGKTEQASEYGKANLSATEWAAVPAPGEWKIDSPDAHAKALAAYSPGTNSTPYTMGFVTYIPQQSTQTDTKPMTWVVTFDPASMNSKVTTSTVYVNATTGAVTVPK